ncbi:uncharacterized protein [Clytia hemisphaerica]|uniref:Uncharacterized protein n=1 Tax=Clytia hemisphaerica TaxID=252671 RepID=A0A7M5X655_9CNID
MARDGPSGRPHGAESTSGRSSKVFPQETLVHEYLDTLPDGSTEKEFILGRFPEGDKEFGNRILYKNRIKEAVFLSKTPQAKRDFIKLLEDFYTRIDERQRKSKTGVKHRRVNMSVPRPDLKRYQALYKNHRHPKPICLRRPKRVEAVPYPRPEPIEEDALAEGRDSPAGEIMVHPLVDVPRVNGRHGRHSPGEVQVHPMVDGRHPPEGVDPPQGSPRDGRAPPLISVEEMERQMPSAILAVTKEVWPLTEPHLGEAFVKLRPPEDRVENNKTFIHRVMLSFFSSELFRNYVVRLERNRNLHLMRTQVLSEKPCCKIAYYRSFVRDNLQQRGFVTNHDTPEGFLMDVRPREEASQRPWDRPSQPSSQLFAANREAVIVQPAIDFQPTVINSPHDVDILPELPSRFVRRVRKVVRVSSARAKAVQRIKAEAANNNKQSWLQKVANKIRIFGRGKNSNRVAPSIDLDERNEDFELQPRSERSEPPTDSLHTTHAAHFYGKRPRKFPKSPTRRGIEEGSYPNWTVKANKLPSPILRFTWKGKLEKLEKFLLKDKNHCQINLSDERKRTALHYAASWGCAETTKLLLNIKGLSINAQDEHGKTPLYKAVENGSLEIVKLLVEAGADSRIAACDDRDPLGYLLAYHGDERFELFKYLWKVSPRSDDDIEAEGISLIHRAILTDPSVTVLKCVNHMLSNGLHVDARLPDGETPAHLAALYDREELLELLLAHQANPYLKDKDKNTPKCYTKQGSTTRKCFEDYSKYGPFEVDEILEMRDGMSKKNMKKAKRYRFDSFGYQFQHPK